MYVCVLCSDLQKELARLATLAKRVAEVFRMEHEDGAKADVLRQRLLDDISNGNDLDGSEQQ